MARLQLTLGQSQVGLGYADKAITLFTKARTTFNTHLGPDHDDTLTSMGSLAGDYRDAGKLNLSVSLLEEVVQRRTAQSGPDHLDTLGAMNNLAGATVTPESSTWPCRSSRRHSSAGRPSSVPTIPTRSTA